MLHNVSEVMLKDLGTASTKPQQNIKKYEPCI